MRRGLLTLGLLAACRDRTPEPAPVPPPHEGVTLIQAGAPPLHTLRYRLTKGDKTASALMYDVDVKTDGQSGPMSTLVVAFETTVEEVLDDGAARLRIAVVDASVRDRPGSEPSEVMRAETAALRGVVITETLAPDGNISGSRVEVAGSSDQASGQLDTLLRGLERVAMRLPAEPVGLGAMWRERRTLPEGGIRATSDMIYTLGSVSGSTFAYTSTGHSTGGPQTIEQGGLKVEVSDTHGRSTVYGTVDLSRYALEATATSTFATTMTIAAPDAGPGSGRSTVEVAMAIRMTPASTPPAAGEAVAPAPAAASAPADKPAATPEPAAPSPPAATPKPAAPSPPAATPKPAAPSPPAATPDKPAAPRPPAVPAADETDHPSAQGAHSAP